jgi:hypothetical protein
MDRDEIAGYMMTPRGDVVAFRADGSYLPRSSPSTYTAPRGAALDRDDDGEDEDKITVTDTKPKKKSHEDNRRRTKKTKKTAPRKATKKAAAIAFAPGRDPVSRARAAARKLERLLGPERRVQPRAATERTAPAPAPSQGFDLAALDEQSRIKAILLGDPSIDLRAAHAQAPPAGAREPADAHPRGAHRHGHRRARAGLGRARPPGSRCGPSSAARPSAARASR